MMITSKPRAEVITKLGRQLLEHVALKWPANSYNDALELVSEFPDDAGKVKFLSAFAPHLSSGLFPKVLRLLENTFTTYRYRTEAFCNLVPYLPSDQFPAALQLITSSIHPPHYQATALQTLIPLLPLQSLSTALGRLKIQGVDAPCVITQPNLQAQLLSCTASRLSALQHPIGDPSQFIETLDFLVAQIFESTKNLSRYEQDSFACEQATAQIFSQLAPAAQTLETLGQYLPGTAKQTILRSVPIAIKDFGYQAEVFSAFLAVEPASNITLAQAARLPEIIEQQLNHFPTSIYCTFLKIKIRTAYPHTLQEAQLKLLLNSLKNNQHRHTAALVKVACHPLGHHHQTLALRAIRALPQDLRFNLIRQLIPSLKPNQCLEVADIIRELSDPYDRARAFVTLASAHANFRNDAQDIIGQLNEPLQRLEQFSCLAVEMPELLPQVIALAEDKSKDFDWHEALMALSPHLPIRINNEVAREFDLGHPISNDLWQCALYILRRSYRNALKGGSLRNESAQNEDGLNLKDEVNALADLLLMRDLEPPMAVGILGGWGGGKSYIMHLMQQHMTQRRSSKVEDFEAWNDDPNHERLSPYVGHIYQIKFDAWTFAKSDLWASLMQTIFFELDRQLTLEKQLTEVLADLDDTRRREIETKVWPVLYKSNDDEREWFLKNVLKDEQLLDKLLTKQNDEGRTGILWEQFRKSQETAIKALETTRVSLLKKRQEIDKTKSELREQIRQEFAPIFQLKENESFQRVDALLGTSFLILRRRIGTTAFKDLNEEIHDQLFGSGASQNRTTNLGLWKKLEDKLEELDNAQTELDKLTNQAVEKAPNQPDSEESGLPHPSSETSSAPPNSQAESASSEGESSVVKQNDGQLGKSEQGAQQNVNRLLREVAEIRFDIFNVATTAIESKRKLLDWKRNLNWVKSNWLLLTLLFFLFVVPLILLATLGINLYTQADDQIANLTAKVATLIAPLLPGAALLQNLIRSGQKWFEETQLALHEYETSVERRNKELESTYEQTVATTLETNPRLQQLQQELDALERDYKAKKQAVPTNQYASLSAFVSDRLEQGTYKNRLGLMQQVKQDLADLSNKLLPPSQYEESFRAKLDFLTKAFPRGPARVVVYIDDLDRCPPNRVVEVLEAVQLLVKTPLFIAVLAIDERYITRALEKYYDGVLTRRGRPSGTDYLEKIIQLPYRVRPIMPNTLESYLRSQIVIQDGGSGGAKFSEFSRQEFDMLLECCTQVDLSPRTLKRLTNVYKLFKIVCRTRGTKPSTQVQKAILALLALSGRYPDLMRGVFDDIETCYEEQRTEKEAELQKKDLHLDSSLRKFFEDFKLPDHDQYLERELEKLQHDALYTNILPPNLTLRDLSHEIFNLIRSFSFVGEIGEDPEDYRYSGPVSDQSLTSESQDKMLSEAMNQAEHQNGSTENPPAGA